MTIITFEDFDKVDLHSGTVTKVEDFPKARKPAFKIWVDFGPVIGELQTSAQVTFHYTPQSLLGKIVIGCTNLAEKNIGGFKSQFLLVGFPDSDGNIVLLTADSVTSSKTDLKIDSKMSVNAIPNGQKAC